eukprot:8858146-Pyramimonas_sp.AAC.1
MERGCTTQPRSPARLGWTPRPSPRASQRPAARRAEVCGWARRCVVPKVREAERVWFCEQLALLSDEGL